MTTIIGIEDLDGCVMLADSQTTSGDRPYFDKSLAKIIHKGDYLIAVAGSGRASDIINWRWKTPSVEHAVDLYEFMITHVVPSIRLTLSANNYTQEKDDDLFVMLIAVRGRIFEIETDGTVLVRQDGVYGIGTGAPYAIGALAAGATHDEAMQIALRNDIYTGGDIQWVRQGAK